MNVSAPFAAAALAPGIAPAPSPRRVLVATFLAATFFGALFLAEAASSGLR
jgi:hypothetical protein